MPGQQKRGFTTIRGGRNYVHHSGALRFYSSQTEQASLLFHKQTSIQTPDARLLSIGSIVP